MIINPEKKALWLEALRSGNYQQGQRALAFGDGDEFRYCCLGVACEVAIADGVELRVNESPLLNGSRMYDSGDTYLPARVQDWLGISALDLWFEGPYTLRGTPEREWRNQEFEGRVHLSKLNDAGATFEEIADLIEEKF